ncbi:hypothetical protein LCGC14_0209550 [marine sediment metagenome]|uniref:Uncharacterized protein n=1 Tax=marine sediment metagenome TaxID=412755 RepID=A0A0F9ULH2_9ZZZZ
MVLKTDNDYRLVRRHMGTIMRHTYLEHKCPVPEGHDDEGCWRGRIFSVQARGWKCSWCKSRPSDGLQAIFWIMKEEPNG